MLLQVGLFIYPEVEVLDFAGPFEVFSTASRVHARTSPQAPAPFAPSLVAETREPVRARGGLAVLPHFAIDGHPPLDVLIVPGGVHDPELGKPQVLSWIARQHASTRLTASVCTGAFLLAAAGLLDGLEVTTHFEDAADLRRAFPGTRVLEGVRFTEGERIMTSAGISAGLDMSLRVVARFAGQDLAERTARQMDYDWRKRA
ncbi:MAG TPA: DJ-1/PfpI family protein [Anaeromyxobacteraceae bacterium]|nr:DJ-1/PfpI family protein [Anaeromyxobacteraceae bacterium]